MPSEIEVKATFDLSCIGVGFQVVRNNTFPNRQRPVEIELIPPFGIGPIHGALSISICPELLNGSQLSPPFLCDSEFEEMILGDQQSCVCLRKRSDRLSKEKEN